MGCSHCDLRQTFICKREEQRETQAEGLKLMPPFSRHVHGLNQPDASSLPLPIGARQIPPLSVSVGGWSCGVERAGRAAWGWSLPLPLSHALQRTQSVREQDGIAPESPGVHRARLALLFAPR